MGVNNMFYQLISKKLAYLNDFFKLLQKYNTPKIANFYLIHDKFTSNSEQFSI